MADEKAIETPKVNLEANVSFSWKNMIKDWANNMKDPLDPVYKGVKMGAFFWQAIPTWSRQYDDGLLKNDNHFVTGVSAVFTAGTIGAIYWFGGVQTIPHKFWDYEIIAVPVASQAVSYIAEAGRRSMKNNKGKIVITRIKHAIDNSPGEGYDLSMKDIVDKLAPKQSASKRKKKEAETDNWGRQIQQQPEPETFDDTANNYQREQVSEAILGVAKKLYKELTARSLEGKTYELSSDFTLKSKNELSYRDAPNDSMKNIYSTIRETVKNKGGKAKIELLGDVTAIYDAEGKVSYKVKPNNLWKVALFFGK